LTIKRIDDPVWDFVQPENYIFPELHAEIGLLNNVLGNIYTFIDDQLEAVTQEELKSRNSFIVADVALTIATEHLREWKKDVASKLESDERTQVCKELKRRGLDTRIFAELGPKMEHFKVEILDMVKQRKD
jgi:hypothetical protein